MTLWVGHLSKLVAEDDLSDAFGEQGQVNTIDLIPPRGCAFVCMNRRQDAYRVLNKLHKHKIHGKPITVRSNVDVQISLNDYSVSLCQRRKSEKRSNKKMNKELDN